MQVITTDALPLDEFGVATVVTLDCVRFPTPHVSSPGYLTSVSSQIDEQQNLQIDGFYIIGSGKNILDRLLAIFLVRKDLDDAEPECCGPVPFATPATTLP